MAIPTLHETVLSERLVVLTLGGDAIETSFGANCLALASSSGTLLVDPMVAPAHARLVDEALPGRGFPEVTHVVLTHHHTDHALGAGWFAARAASVIAHARCAEAMAAQHPATVAARRRVPELAALFADAEPHFPSVRFEESHAVDLGDVAVEVRHLGPGHTPGDAVVLFPSEDTVACGDSVFRGYHFNYEEADAPALLHRLGELERLPVSRFVPGHGPAGGRETPARAGALPRGGGAPRPIGREPGGGARGDPGPLPGVRAGGGDPHGGRRLRRVSASGSRARRPPDGCSPRAGAAARRGRSRPRPARSRREIVPPCASTIRFTM